VPRARSKARPEFAWRDRVPAFERPIEVARFGKSQQIRDLQQSEIRLRQILTGQLATGVVQQLLEAAALLLQSPLQRALRQVQRLSDRLTPRLTLRQQPAEHLTSLMRHPTARETRQVLASETIMQLCQRIVGGGQ